MKISKIILKNFKFFKELSLDVNEKNILLFGENGSGKSSLYYALHTICKIFFSKDIKANKYYPKKLDIKESNNLCNQHTGANSTIELDFSDDQKIKQYIANENTDVENIERDNIFDENIHFLNHNKLLDIFSKDNFYYTIKEYFFEKFILFGKLKQQEGLFNEPKNTGLDTQNLNNELKKCLRWIQFLINFRLKHIFKENLRVSFDFEPYMSDLDETGKKNLKNPNINIKVNNHNDFRFRINEARVKLISLLFVFTLIEHNKKKIKNTAPNLLVMDDILLSIDMHNRTQIIDYIFDKMKDFQIFIFTHDIFFFNLIKKRVKCRMLKSSYYNYIAYDYNNFGEIYKEDDSYLDKAKKHLDNNQLDECGNNIRKEMEKLIRTISYEFDIGKRFNLFESIESFLKLKHMEIYQNPHDTINKIINILEEHIEDKYKISKISSCIQKRTKKELKTLIKILKDFQWYRDLIGNASSHANILQKYKKEFQNAIDCLDKFKKEIKID